MNEELEKLFGDKKIPLKDLLKRCWIYFKPEIWRILLALLIVIANVALDVSLPLLIENVTDMLSLDGSQMVLKALISWAIGYLLLSIANQGLLFLESMILTKSGQRIVYRLRVEVFEHIERMSLDQINEMPVGSLVTRVANYTDQMSKMFTKQVVNLIRSILTIVAVYAAMLSKSWQLSLILLIFISIIFVGSFYFSIKVHKLFKKEKKYLSDINTNLSESLSGMKIIQLFNQQEKKYDEFGNLTTVYRKNRYSIMMMFGVYRPFINLMYYLALGTTFICGIKYGLTSGAIVAFFLYLSKFFNPVEAIADEYVHIQRALTSSERLFNLLDVEPKAVDKENALKIQKFTGKIEFKNVWFAYEKDNWVLKDVSFVIKPGETCAFVGATGAGKTTIFSLLVRNYVPQKGQILIDDIDINDIRIQDIRKAIGQMLQDVFLFSGTIEENITLFDDEKSKKDVEDSATYVNAEKFIVRLPNKYDTEVVERGENFSQGQRQLLSFARTIIQKPQILLLDEATANIDTETEVLIQDSLEKMKNIGTMLIVAHRLSTIQNSDQIICLQNGSIVEVGNHQQLLKKRGYYYKLYELQFNN